MCVGIVLPDEQHRDGGHGKQYGREGRTRVFQLKTDSGH
jgi:hypothetical protein